MPEARESSKTVLIVDDEEIVREFVSAVLSDNYKLLVAASGEEAMQISDEHGGTIHLLLSNVQMKGMNGLELATKLNVKRPAMRVMLMSGFSSGMLVLNEGWHFLHKPFMPTQLRDLVSGLIARHVDPANVDEHSQEK